eukprot:8721421-Alexandrium_andersonii.AAC.1
MPGLSGGFVDGMGGEYSPARDCRRRGGHGLSRGGLTRDTPRSSTVRMRRRFHAAKARTVRMNGGHSCPMAGAVGRTGGSSLSRAH